MIKICHHCEHKMTAKQKLCHYTVVGIKFLMHYACAVEVKERANKTLQAISQNFIFKTDRLYPFQKSLDDYKIRLHYLQN